MALAGVVSYGVVYLIASLFYGPLGIKPADVGLGYAELLAQTAVYLALLCLPAALGVALSYSFARQNLEAATASALRLSSPTGERDPKEPEDLHRPVGADSPADPPPVAPSATSSKSRAYAAIIGIWVGALALFPTLLLGTLAASNRVQNGQATGGDFFGLRLSPWSTSSVARIEWTGSSPAPSLPRCVIRLGTAAGTEVLYDARARTTLRLPQASVAVTIDPEATECSSPPSR